MPKEICRGAEGAPRPRNKPQRINLSDTKIERLKAEDKPRDFYDAKEQRLVLRVGKNSKTWRILYRDAKGKRSGELIGRWPEFSVKEAREQAARAKIAARDRVEHPPAPPEPTYAEVVENYYQRVVLADRLRSARGIKAYLDTVVLPAWGDKAFASIRRGDVTKLLDQVADERGPRAADMVLAFIRRIGNWHQSRTEDYVNPVVKGMSRTKPALRRRKRILDDEEIRVMWHCCEKLGTAGALFRCLLLLCQRRTATATMRWSEITDGVWRPIRPYRAKGVIEQAKLPPLARTIIEAQPVVLGSDYVFPASRKGRRDGPGENFGSYSAFEQAKSELDKLMRVELPEMPHWTLHDLRRTGRSLLARAGVPQERAERVLAHAVNALVATYDRFAYTDEVNESLATLDALITRIVFPPAPNVVALPKRRKQTARPTDNNAVELRSPAPPASS